MTYFFATKVFLFKRYTLQCFIHIIVLGHTEWHIDQIINACWPKNRENFWYVLCFKLVPFGLHKIKHRTSWPNSVLTKNEQIISHPTSCRSPTYSLWTAKGSNQAEPSLPKKPEVGWGANLFSGFEAKWSFLFFNR